MQGLPWQHGKSKKAPTRNNQLPRSVSSVLSDYSATHFPPSASTDPATTGGKSFSPDHFMMHNILPIANRQSETLVYAYDVCSFHNMRLLTIIRLGPRELPNSIVQKGVFYGSGPRISADSSSPTSWRAEVQASRAQPGVHRQARAVGDLRLSSRGGYRTT